MADRQQPTAVAAAGAAYSTKQIADSKAIMNEILAELKAAPDVQVQFVKLLSGLATDGGDMDAVGSRAADLLRGHPDVLRRFTAVVHTPFTAEAHVDDAPAEEAGLALTTPRRRRSGRRNTQTQQTPAAAAPPEAAPNVATAAARNHRVVDDGRLRLDDDDDARALTFVKRVHETAGPVIHDRFLAVLSAAERSEDMFADEIYRRAKQAFGPAHVGLLHAFATAWLPGEEEWKLQQQQQARGDGPAARQRSRAAVASVSHAGMPGAKTKPRADDDDGCARRHDDPAVARRQRSRAAAASSHAAAGMPDAKKPKPRADDGSNGRQQDRVIAVLEVRNVKKRRADDDGTGRGRDALRIGESSGGGVAPAPQGRDYDHDYAPRSRAKKLRPHSGNGEFSGSAAAAQVLGADAAGVHLAYSGDNKKPPRRRAASGGKGSSAGAAGAEPQTERDDEVRRFRQEWEFQTCYSKLVATIDRVTELLRRRRRRTPHGDGDRSLEALFPLPECRDFLRSCYGDRWGEMRAALERGESRVPALEAIARSLTTKEEEAVSEESRKRCRHDPVRVAQRLHGLAVATHLDEERRRHHGGGA